MKTFFSLILVFAIFVLCVWAIAKAFRAVRLWLQKRKSKSVDEDLDKEKKGGDE